MVGRLKTTTRHKEHNTFRFETFAVKLNKINKNFNVNLRDGRRLEGDDEDVSSYFYQALVTRTELDLTESFTNLVNEIGPDIKTLHQIIHNRDRLIKLLLEQIREETAKLSFNSTLELLKSLALDLGKTFCPHMPEFVQAVCEVILKSKNPHEIEIGFQYVAQLFVNFRSHVNLMYSTYLELLIPMWSSKNKKYITIFTGECFSVISTKVWRKSPVKFFESLRNTVLKPHPETIQGIAYLLSAMIKNAKGDKEMKKFIAGCLCSSEMSSDDGQDVWDQTLWALVEQLKECFHERNDVFKLFCACIEEGLVPKDNLRPQAFISYLRLYFRTLTGNLAEVTVEEKCPSVMSILEIYNPETSIKGFELPSPEGVYLQSILADMICSFINKSPESPSPQLLELTLEFIKRADVVPLNMIFYSIMMKNWALNMYLIQVVERKFKIEGNDHRIMYLFVKCVAQAISFMRDRALISDKNQCFTISAVPQYYKAGYSHFSTELTIRKPKRDTYDPCSFVNFLFQDYVFRGGILPVYEHFIHFFITFGMVQFDEGHNPPCCLTTCIDAFDSIATEVSKDTIARKASSKLQAIFSFGLYAILEHEEDITISLKKFRISDYFKWMETEVTYSYDPNEYRISLWALKSLDDLLGKSSYFKLMNSFGRNIPSTSAFHIPPSLLNALTRNLGCGFKIVRSICLSILWQLEGLDTHFNDERKDALNLCLKIEGMSIRELKFITSVSESFDKLKGMASRKALFPVIINFVLGYMFTNFKLVWPKCIEILKLCFSTDADSAWKEFQSAFINVDLHTDLNIPKEFDDFNGEGFMGRITQKYFSLCKELESSTAGSYEKLDITRYRANVWTVLEGVDERNSVEAVLPRAISLITRVTQKSPFCGLDRTNETKGLREYLIPVLNYLAKNSTIMEEKNRIGWFDLLKDLLVSPLEIRLIVFNILCRLRRVEMQPYAETLESAVRSSSLIELRELGLGSASSAVKPEHEVVILQVISRIILEKSQGRSKDQKDKGNRDELLRTVAICGHSAVFAFIDLALKWDPCQGFRDVPTSLKVVEGRVALIDSMINTWRYHYPDVPEQLVLKLCCMISCVNKLDPEDAVNLKKQTISMARDCLLTYFKVFAKIQLEETTIDAIFSGFVWDGVDDTMKSAVTNVTWVLKLFAEWSQVLRYHELFTRVRGTGPDEETLPSYIFQILSLETTDVKVKLHLLTIIFNLISGGDPNLMDEDEVFDQPILIKSPLEIGQNIIRSGKSEIIQALKDGKLFKELCLTGKNSEFHLRLLPSLTNFLDDSDLLTTLIGVVIGSLKACRLDDDKLVECFKSLRVALSGLDENNQRPVIKQIATMFSWVKRDEPRKALYEILLEWKNDEYRPLIVGINSWVLNMFNTTDYASQYKALQACEDKIKSTEAIDYLFLELVALSCFYGLEANNQRAEVRRFTEILHEMSMRLQREFTNRGEENIVLAREFIMSVILPQFRLGIRREKAYDNVIPVLSLFIQELWIHHGTFSELKFLVEEGILEMLTELQIQRRTLGMNKLVVHLEAMRNGSADRVSAANLECFIQPMAYNNLLKEAKSGDSVNMNELVDSSINVLKGILWLYPYPTYLKVIFRTLGWKTSSFKVMKQLERILIGAMESFHYDLSALEKKDMSAVDEPDDLETPRDDEVAVPINSHFEILNKEAAEKLIKQLTQNLIPQLTQCMKESRIKGHKLAGENTTILEEGLGEKRIAFGSALANLIRKLPKKTVKDIWNTFIPNLCSSVRSKQQDVRNSARRSLVGALKEMGMSYFPLTFKHLKASLQRGYEKHVLHFTVGRIFQQCEKEFREFPTAIPIKGILELCSEELFGYMREEKTVQKITVKTAEAKNDNARPMLCFCAKFAQDTVILSQMLSIPLERFAQTPENSKAARSWLLEMSNGLLKNEYIAVDDLLIWLGAQLETCSDTTGGETTTRVLRKRRTQKPDSALVIKGLESTRVANHKGHTNVLVTEFVLQCLYDRLKDKEIGISSELSKAFIPHIVDGLSGKSRKVNLLCLRCVTSLIEYGDFDLSRDQKVLNSIWRHTFLAMSTISLGSTNEHEMVNAIFKCLTTFLGNFTTFKILEKDFELMLKSIKAFLTHGHCSSGAMSLLKGITRKKLVSTEFHSLMDSVKELSITSHQDHILEGCRGLYADYILNYCTKPDDCMEKLKYYLHQLRYQSVEGRRSAMIMLHMLFVKVPECVRKEFKIRYFAGMILELDYETDSTNKKKAYDCVKGILRSSNESYSDCLMKLNKLIRNKEMAYLNSVLAQVGGWIVADGWKHIGIRIKMTPLFNFYTEVILTNSRKESNDSTVVQTLIGIHKIMSVVLKGGESWDPQRYLESRTSDILQHLRIRCLHHDHLWVKKITLQIYACVFNCLDSTLLLTDLNNDTGCYCSLVSTYSELNKIIGDHMNLFKSPQDISNLIDTATINLNIFMRLAIKFANDKKGKQVLSKFIPSLAQLISHEVTQSPASTTQRSVAYKVLDTFVSEGDVEVVKSFNKRLLRSCVRDSSDANTPSDIKTISEALIEKLKKKIGEQFFRDEHVDVLQTLQDRRVRNRATKKENTVVHGLVPKKRKRPTSSSEKSKSDQGKSKKRKQSR